MVPAIPTTHENGTDHTGYDDARPAAHVGAGKGWPWLLGGSSKPLACPAWWSLSTWGFWLQIDGLYSLFDFWWGLWVTCYLDLQRSRGWGEPCEGSTLCMWWSPNKDSDHQGRTVGLGVGWVAVSLAGVTLQVTRGAGRGQHWAPDSTERAQGWPGLSFLDLPLHVLPGDPSPPSFHSNEQQLWLR